MERLLAVAALAFIVSACGARPPEKKLEATPPPRGVLSEDWIYMPASPEALETTGPLKVEPGISAEGPTRVLLGARGMRLDAVLVGPAPLGVSYGAQTLGDVLEARVPGAAMVYRVTQGNLCSGVQATHVVWYEPEMIEGRTLSLAVAAGGAPGQTGSTFCKVLRYTREREPSYEASK